jgi:tetratricopeptide (TPR) repeat protein
MGCDNYTFSVVKEGSVMKKCAMIFVLVSIIISSAGSDHTVFAEEKHKEEPLETIADAPRRTRLAMFKSQEQRDRGDFDESVQILLEFLERHPNEDHYLLRFQLANSLSQAERHDEALEHYRATVRLEERYTQAWLNLGEVAFNEGQYDIAAEALMHGYEQHAEKPTHLLYYSGAAFLMAGQPEEAAEILEKLTTLDAEEPKLDWYRVLIASYAELKDEERGSLAVSRMISDLPGNPESWELAFQFAASLGNYEQAAVALTIISYLRPLSQEEQMQLGDLYTVIGVPAKASTYYEKALENEGSTRELERLASAYLASYNTKEALVTLKRALEAEPTARLWSLLGDLYYMEKDYAEAYVAYSSCTELDPDQGRAFLMMGFCALEMGKVNEAVDNLELASRFTDQKEMANTLLKKARLLNGTE